MLQNQNNRSEQNDNKLNLPSKTKSIKIEAKEDLTTIIRTLLTLKSR